MIRLGIIGFGMRMKSMVQVLLREEPRCRVSAIMDVDPAKVRKTMSDHGIASEGVAFYSEIEPFLAAGEFDALCIGTRCSSHASLAIRVLPLGIPLFLEKPVATTMDDYLLLKQTAEQAANDRVLVSFPLRATPMIKQVKELIDSGAIGSVEHVQAVNNVPYGSVYFHNWYRDEEETQGLFLQKATHDFDYINYVLGLAPTEVAAMTSKRVFTGTKPAGLRCRDCDEQETCTESPANLKMAGEEVRGPFCSFAVDTGNEDSGSALIRYETGMHAVYSQNFYTRKKAAERGARWIGYDGTLEFDWYTKQIRLFRHRAARVETIFVEDNRPHMGGDHALARNFIAMIEGREAPIAPLEDGLCSVYMCLKAKESAETGSFRSLTGEVDDGPRNELQ